MATACDCGTAWTFYLTSFYEWERPEIDGGGGQGGGLVYFLNKIMSLDM